MSYGLVNYGTNMQGEALQGLKQDESRKERRDQINKQQESAKKQQNAGAAVSGAMIGAQYGSTAGPWGAIAGAVIGYAISEWA